MLVSGLSSAGKHPHTNLRKLTMRYLNPADLRPDDKAKRNLLAVVKRFETASLAGEYYGKSVGALAWIADCHRLLDRSVSDATKKGPAMIRQAFDIIFSLPNKSTVLMFSFTLLPAVRQDTVAM